MPRKTPRFWQQDGWLVRALSPFSCFYHLAHNIKTLLCRPYVSSVPVFCIGGVVVGGSGKTPTLQAFAALIATRALYQNPVILLRGYGGTIRTATLVDPLLHTYKDVGDEALLHAAILPTIVSANRAAGARLAERMGADIILMDDGLQNNTLQKTSAVLVLDSRQGLGNRRLLPAGPLREPLRDALNKVAAIVQIGDDMGVSADKPVLKARVTSAAAPDPGKIYVAFAGLGRPEKFQETLMEQGFPVSDFIPFPDHHPYSDNDMKKLAFLAEGKTLMTTTKDFVRIPPACRAGVEVMPITLTFEDPDAAAALLKAPA